MKRSLWVLAIVFVAVVLAARTRHERNLAEPAQPVESSTPADGPVGHVDEPVKPDVPASFSCDGRTYCSQMTSCEEAKYFLQHCPNTKMDGDHNGIPCERQWCTRG